ncbi:hypothetical protein [Endothiovibrio diazotrophicus]
MRIDSYTTLQQLLGQQQLTQQLYGQQYYAHQLYNQQVAETQGLDLQELLSVGQTGSTRQTTGSSDYLSAVYGQVTLSSFGLQISDLYQSLKGIDDSAAREEAGDGLTAVMRDLMSNPDGLRTVTFLAGMNDTLRTDPQAFKAFFEAADQVNDAGYSLTRWIDTYSRIEDEEAQQAFVAETDELLTSTGEDDATLQREVFNQLLDNVNRIASSGLDGAALSSRYDQYFGGLNPLSGMEEKQVYMARFEAELKTAAVYPSGTAA